MKQNGVEIEESQLAEHFAEFFSSKIKTLVDNANLNPNVYNGTVRVHSLEKNFMTEEKIIEAVKSLKMKNCEGSDRLPQRMLVDGLPILINSFVVLFNNVYTNQFSVILIWSS